MSCIGTMLEIPSMGKRLKDERLLAELEKQTSGETKQHPSKIPLAIGMPVIVSQNFDVNGGIVNGSMGLLTKIRYSTNQETGKRYLRSCVVKLQNISSDRMLGLADDEFPVMEDTISIPLTHPHTCESCSIRRTQVPIQPAFVLTAHKAQGQTFS